MSATQAKPEVAYHTLDTPIGPLLLAATAVGLVRVAFECEDFDTVRAELGERLHTHVVLDPERLAGAVTEIGHYFTGTLREFTGPLDQALSSGFRAEVHRYLPQIPYGQTQSYREIAQALGNPGAVRAVGSACATNPLPIIVPCHRVVRSDGSLGGYRGGLEIKRTLLALEQDFSVG